MNYEDFIASKTQLPTSTGIADVPELHPILFPFQRESVAWALRRGRAAMFEECGLGKTFQQLEWSRVVADVTRKPVLIFAPLAVSQQTIREAAKLGICVRYASERDDVTTGVWITNYERVERFVGLDIGGVVLDECFEASTPVDVVVGNRVERRPISSIRVGDLILNASGVDTVSDIHRREVPYAVRVRAGGESFVASPNHPVFTQKGWISVQDLEPGDALFRTSASVRVVQEGIFPEVEAGCEDAAFLRDVLLSELAHVTAGDSCEGSQLIRVCKTREVSICEVQERRPGITRKESVSNPSNEPSIASRDEREGVCPIERDRARTFRAWRKRKGNDSTAIGDASCSRAWMGERACLVTGPTDSRLSHALQARLSERRSKSVHRGGWQLALCEEKTGRKEGREASFVRVDGIEVLEPTDPALDGSRMPDGKLYFFDLGGTQHPSFSVCGYLVHNSSILKSFMGKTKRLLVSGFEAVPYRLACTATPAPNDHIELGNHSEFLGVLPSSEMLTRFFINDTSLFGNYRLKGHAENHFWNWVCSWARCISRPSDVGHDDTGYALPELRIHRHVVDVDVSDNRGDKLFRIPDMSATSVHKEKRLTASDRAARVAGIVASEPEETWIVWCDTDYEADALTSAIPGSVEVRGSQSLAVKEKHLIDFTEGRTRILISKPSLTGHGLNWQHCARVAFIGAAFSYEQFHQAVRRTWRFGQSRPVDVHVTMAATEVDVWNVMQRKQLGHIGMSSAMVEAMKRATHREATRTTYQPSRIGKLPSWMSR